MTDSNFIIVSVVRGGNLNGTGTKLHVDDNRVRDDWNSAVDERVDGEFSVKMLQLVQTSNTETGSRALTVYLGSSGWTAIAVSPSIVSGRVVAMMICSSVEKHKRGYFYFLMIPTRSFDGVPERSENTEFKFLLDVIAGNIQKRPPS
jgi:hypothetical protein